MPNAVGRFSKGYPLTCCPNVTYYIKFPVPKAFLWIKKQTGR
jgi:hypothetical protein